MTKIDIVSGFLGAGKTTLIKKMLQEAFQGEKLVLIENEFGEISIDGGFLKDSGVQISEMSSGCICCSLVGDFGKALVDVQKKFTPDRILIEPSGVGKLSDVILAVENTVKDVPEMKLNSFVTVADAAKVKVYMKNFGEFYNNQIETAGTIILSRTQKVSPEKLEAAVALLREKNKDAAIITTPWDQLDGKTILAAMEKVSLADELMERIRAEHEAEEEEHHHHHQTMTTRIMTSTIMSTTITTMTRMRTRSTNTITIITRTGTSAATSMSMSIIMTMTTKSTSTTITTTASATTRSAPATTITTTPTRCSPAGAQRRLRPSRRRTLTGSSRLWTAANTALFCGPRASYPARAASGCTLTMCPRSTRCASARRTTPDGCASSAPSWTRAS